jgi:hypothetical protein
MKTFLKNTIIFLFGILLTYFAPSIINKHSPASIMAETLKVGDSIPADTAFTYIAYTPESADITSCGIPIKYDAVKGEYTITVIVHNKIVVIQAA